jgi:8-oxo-dGTP pyrophosphatase MutT (NUDIX family)
MIDEDYDANTIKAAGGLVWRDSAHGREVAVIHRARYGDWTLPKGKLKPGEDWESAAVREVKEETGYDVHLKSFAGKVNYSVEGIPKVVQFWNMEPIGESKFESSEEVESVMWLPVQKALEVLDYDGERELLRATANDEKDISRIVKLKHWIRMNLCGSIDDSRLSASIHYYEKRLEYLKKENPGYDATWSQLAGDLLNISKEALKEGDKNLGWQCLDAARSFSFLVLKDEYTKDEAPAILNEANDKVNPWRKKTIQDRLCDDTGKIKEKVKPRDLFNASTILYEHQHNQYNKISIIKRELIVLASVAAMMVFVWLKFAPELLTPEPGKSIPIYDHNYLFSVALFGIMGASISGILTVARGGTEARIPEQLIDLLVLSVKLVVGAASALAIFAFMISNFFNLGPTPAAILAVSFAAGFSERLVTLAVESVPAPQAPNI